MERYFQEEHGVAFTVAKAMRLDLLEDIRNAVEKAISEGTTFYQFKKDLTPILKKKGWWGIGHEKDPLTGEMKKVQLGSNRRLEIIFDTNLKTAHAFGRWERYQRVKKQRPYIRYVAVNDESTRPQHKAWHGLVLDIDDKFWDTHFPPNGWFCRCNTQQLSERDLIRYGYKLSKTPKVEMRDYINNRTGEITKVPKGIDAGFCL